MGEPVANSGIAGAASRAFRRSARLAADLAERGGIELARVSVRDMVEQFVAALLRFEREVVLERRADWLVLTTILVLLRFRLLLPASAEAAQTVAEEAEQERAQLRELRFTKAAAAWLEARLQPGRDVFPRGQRGRDPQGAAGSSARAYHMAPRLIASAEEIDRQATEEAPDMSALAGSRRDVFGAGALTVKASRIARGRVKLLPLSS